MHGLYRWRMGTSSTDRYVDPITSYDDAIFDYVALHEVVTRKSEYSDRTPAAVESTI